MTRRRRAGGSWLIAALVGMLHLPAHPASLFDGKNPRDHWRGWAQETYPEAWVAGHHHLDRIMGAINTVFLLCSSFTMVMAVHSASTNQKSKTVVNLLLTLGFAAGFLVTFLVVPGGPGRALALIRQR